MKSVLIVVPTRSKTIEEFQTREISKSLDALYEHYKTVPDVSLDFNLVTNNTEGLSKVYNKFLTKDNEKKIVVFCHDDLNIHNLDVVDRLNDAIKQFDIVGLAGTSEFKRGDVAWHTHEGKWRDKSVLSGKVWHNLDGNHNESVFGELPKRCIVMDGLFLAVNVEKALQADWKFDEDFNWNFYDLSSCLFANEKKLKMGTWDIPVTHFSGGGGENGYGSPSWQIDADNFVNKWKENDK